MAGKVFFSVSMSLDGSGSGICPDLSTPPPRSAAR